MAREQWWVAREQWWVAREQRWVAREQWWVAREQWCRQGLVLCLCVAPYQSYNIYRKLCVDVLSMPLGEGGYRTYADLRDMLLSLVGSLARSAEASGPAAQEFERLLLVAHYTATRAACSGVPQLKDVVAKISVALLRYTDILPADRAFYEAGSQAKVGTGPSAEWTCS